MWRDLYRAEEDELSPFFGREYSEFEFTNQVYNFLIHPQWDDFGSPTLLLKILYVDYDEEYAIIELLGEWNDAINNDIMDLKREVIELLMEEGISKFIMIGENVLNFHGSDDSYYEEWFQDIEDGWIAFVNFNEHVLSEFRADNIDYFVNFGGELDEMPWRTWQPHKLYEETEKILNRRLGVG